MLELILRIVLDAAKVALLISTVIVLAYIAVEIYDAIVKILRRTPLLRPYFYNGGHRHVRLVRA